MSAETKSVSTGSKLRIMIVDDHTIAREGIKQILTKPYPDAEFGFARHAREALDLLKRDPWDVMLLDINLPGGPDGLDVLAQAQDIRPETKILVMSAHGAAEYALRVKKLGAAGYLTKDDAIEKIVTAVEKVLAGGTYFAGELADGPAEGFVVFDGSKPHQALSNREYQVLLLLANGKSIKEIAYETALSTKTVNTYRTRVFEKMGFKSNAEAIRYMVKEGLVQ